MAEKKYQLRIEEITDSGSYGVDYAIINEYQYRDIMDIASVQAEDYEPLILNEILFG